MNNINLDINTYNIEELENLLKLQKNYNSENIYNAKESIANSISKSNISESKKTEVFIFLDNIKNKLITNLEIGTNNKSITQYNGNHYILNNNESILGKYKQTNKSTLKKIYTIDSIFRHNYELPDNQSHNYTIQLPETVSRAISMSIGSIEIPLTYHNISSYYNNNVFTIEMLDPDNNKIDSATLELGPGLYEANSIPNIERVIGFNIVNEINNKIKDLSLTESMSANYNPSLAFLNISTNLSFAIEPKSGYGFFRYDNSDNYLGSFKIRINFNVNSINTNASNCYSNNLYQKLGWQLGFRSNSITLTSTNLVSISSAIAYINYPRYIYIALDDFQSSSQNHFAIASDSIVAPNIITRINILSLLEEKTRFKQGAYAGDIYYNQKHIREYFGPTDINKLKIQLLDEYGRQFSLNNMDWSFIMTFECLYN
jgi:hypothetical protein